MSSVADTSLENFDDNSFDSIFDSTECNDDTDYEYEYDDLFNDADYWYNDDKTKTVKFNVDQVTCPICYVELHPDESVVLTDCKHSFCSQCFQSYIKTQIDDGNANRLICPLPRSECGKEICDFVLRKSLDTKALEKLDRCKRNAFVLENKDYHFCPTPDCSNVLFWKEGSGLPIGDCFKCRKVSCLKCKATPYHTNKTCEEWKRYQYYQNLYNDLPPPLFSLTRTGIDRRRANIDRSRANESLNHNFKPSEEWMEKLGIRVCRRCGSGVQKQEGGCNKMKCRCGYRFCFNCGSENAQCDCTPSNHGFTDNITGGVDFSGLREGKSYT